MSLKTTLISTSRFNKKLIVLFTDLFFLCLTTQFSLIISNISLGSIHTEHFLRLLWLPLFSVISFWFLGVYNSVVRFIDFSVIIIIARAIGIVFVINLLVAYSYGTFLEFFQFSNSEPLITSIGWLVGLVTFSFLAIISRLVASLYLSRKDPDKRVVIYGAGSAGIQLANALRVSKEVQPIAFLDDNPSLHGTYLGGIKVLNPTRLERLSQRKKVDEVLIAIPSASRSTLLSLLRDIENFSLKVRILPGLVDLAQGKISVSELKEVDISDLLGRYEVEANLSLINKNIENKVVMVTGAGGSIGSEIARQVAKNTAKKIILLDSNEYALYSIKNEILGYENSSDIYAVLALSLIHI